MEKKKNTKEKEELRYRHGFVLLECREDCVRLSVLVTAHLQHPRVADLPVCLWAQRARCPEALSAQLLWSLERTQVSCHLVMKFEMGTDFLDLFLSSSC